MACRGTQLTRSAVAVRATARRATAWATAVGHQPASSGTWPMAAKSSPKPAPARTPSTSPAASPPSRSGSRLTSQMPGTAATMPIHTSAEGRSPVLTATTTGSSAAPTADTGATTPIRPAANPR